MERGAPQKSGRLILVQMVLTAIPLYILIAMDTPLWLIKAIDRMRRGFLWSGRRDAQGGHCPIAWDRVSCPIHLGGLGIHNLTIMGWALRMRWLWIQKSQPDSPIAAIDIKVPSQVSAMFMISMSTTVGDGAHTAFWVDRWVHGKTVAELMPAVMPFVRKRGWKRCTVQQALTDAVHGSKTSPGCSRTGGASRSTIH